MNIEIKYKLKDQVWGIIEKGNDLVPMELNIIGYRIESSIENPINEITYFTHKTGDSSVTFKLSESSILPSKQAAIIKLKELEDLRHLNELNRIDQYV